jgi:hypothetical protein
VTVMFVDRLINYIIINYIIPVTRCRRVPGMLGSEMSYPYPYPGCTPALYPRGFRTPYNLYESLLSGSSDEY